MSPTAAPDEGPMRIKLSPERRSHLIAATREYFSKSFDEEISDFRAERLVEFFVKEIGAPVYNQAIKDAYGFIQDKLVDLEGEFYEPETPERGS